MGLDDKLSSIERYVMRFIEAECAEKSEQQLREAEVSLHVVITSNYVKNK